MKYELSATGRFKKDLKSIIKRGTEKQHPTQAPS